MTTVPEAPPARVLDPGEASALAWSVDGLSTNHPSLSARRTLTKRQLIGLIIILVAVVTAFVIVPIAIGTIIISSMITIYAAMLIMRIDLARHPESGKRYAFTEEELRRFDDADLPTFTVLVPAYREPEVVPQLVGNLSALDYPADKLQILLLLEEDDDETLAAVAGMNLRTPFSVVIVPPSQPRTKPKALNYALGQSTGDLITVYDAEDRPDPLQLRKVAATLAECGPEVACVQAELSYFNADENIITRWFATEYAMWFRQFLPALAAVNAAIPLGGTSNHIRRDVLVGLGAWDPFNVTEDADLGIRMRRQGFRVAVLDSITLEEANTDFVNWIKQRSRWYKGYAQTWLVHMRHPRQLLRDLGWANFLRFNLFVGGTPGLAALNPVSWLLLAMWFIVQPKFLLDIMPAPVYYAGLFVWVIGNTAFYFLNLAAAYELGLRRVFWAAALLPLYWVMMALAAIKALWQLVVTPNYWEKTQHGLSRQHGQPINTAEASELTVPEPQPQPQPLPPPTVGAV